MGVTATEVIIHGSTTDRHHVFYRCQDHLGAWTSYGPVYAEPGFDAEAFKTVVAAKVEEALAASEFEQIIGD